MTLSMLALGSMLFVVFFAIGYAIGSRRSKRAQESAETGESPK